MNNDVRRTMTTTGLTLLFCFVAALCEGFDVQAAGVAAAGLAHELRPTPERLGLFFSAGNFGLFLGAFVGGSLADRCGRKKVLLASIATFGVFSLATSQAGSMDSLTWLRMLTGFGLGGAMPNLIAMAAEASADKSRNVSMATAYIGMPIGGAISSLVVFFMDAEHWRRVFVIGGVAPLLIALAMAALMPAPVSAHSDSQVSAAAATKPTAVRDLLGASSVRRTLLIWIGFFLMQVTFQIMLNWLPLLMQARGLSKNGAAFAQVGFNVGGASAALLMGFLLDRKRKLVSVAAAVVALPTVITLLANLPASSGLVTALALLIGGAILSFLVILYAVTDISYPARARGTGIGAAVGIGRLGAIVGPAFAGFLVGTGRTPQQVLTGVLPIAVVCGVCVAWLGWLGLRRIAHSVSATTAN
jgi:AAHS family 3-hydroxyphenylpropionic acid transporter